MRRENLKARLLRAVSGKTQEQLGEEIGDPPGIIGQVEQGKLLARPDYLARLAANEGITVADAEDLLRRYETLRTSRRRRGQSAGDLLEGLAEDLRSHTWESYERLVMLPLPASDPRAEDRQRAAELFYRLVSLSPEERLAVVGLEEEFQSWALCEKVCHASEREASRDIEVAAAWADLAKEIAERVRGPEGFPRRVRGYAGGHCANVQRVLGDLKPSWAAFVEAKRLWISGSDPLGLLDPGRMLDLEASLLRDQRHFGEALALLDEAFIVGRSPERALIKKGYTLEVMGEYERAIEALQRASTMIEHTAEPRLQNTVDFNLAAVYCHVGLYREAAELVPGIRILATELGDRWDLIRLGWLEGRIAGGLGQREEAQRLLAQARQAFHEKNLSFDVALTLLEEAVLLLEEGRSAEVKVLARELEKVFKSKGVHREALGALKLFHEAAEREEATAEQARRVLDFLFKARHDEGLRFES
jgi:tetratricopeptide (TPR) repeat protein